MVCELLSDGDWSHEILNTHFIAWEVDEIMKIPLARFGGDDEWAWHFTKNGDFSVRSAYYVELKAMAVTRASPSVTVNVVCGRGFGVQIFPRR